MSPLACEHEALCIFISQEWDDDTWGLFNVRPAAFGIRNNLIPNVTPPPQTCSCFSCMCPLPPSCQHEHILDQEVSPQVTRHWNTFSTFSGSSNCLNDTSLQTESIISVMTCLVILAFLCSGQKWLKPQKKRQNIIVLAVKPLCMISWPVLWCASVLVVNRNCRRSRLSGQKNRRD